jgi:hypothetical protein
VASRTFKLIPGWLPPEFDATGGGHIRSLGEGVEIKADGSAGSPSAAVTSMTVNSDGTSSSAQLEVLLTLRFWGPDVPNQRLGLTATAGTRRLSEPDARYGFEEHLLGGRSVIMREADSRVTASWNEGDVHCSVDSKGVTRDDLRRFITELVRVEPGSELTP